jgi:hypothetical protein
LKSFLDEILNYRSVGPLSVPIPMAGTRTKRKILAGPEPGRKKNYRDWDRDQIKRVAGTKKSWSRTSLVPTLGIRMSVHKSDSLTWVV